VRLNGGEAGSMKTTSEHALLTAEQERELARAIEAGVLAEQLLATGARPVSASATELREVAESGRQAWQRFQLSNLRLVWKLAGQESRRTGLGVDELFQEGCVALAAAVQRYDFTRGRFSTYALTRISQHLSVAGAARLGELALPGSRALQLRRAKSVQARLGMARGGEVGVAELASELQYSLRRAQTLIRYRAPVSIDTCDSAWQLPDQTSEDPEWHHFCGQLVGMLAKVPSDQARVLRLRYGLDGQSAVSIVELAAVMGLSISTVRRLERRGLSALRNLLARIDAEALAG
jgi:RNA polymerase sigma factor (sigma-70 family)